jgi:hypothetical protein
MVRTRFWKVDRLLVLLPMLLLTLTGVNAEGAQPRGVV